VREKRRRERDVFAAADVAALEEHCDRISNLALVRVKIEVPLGRKRAPSIGLKLTEGSDGALVVELVSGLAEMIAHISPGFVTVSFSREEPLSEVRTGTLSGNFEGGSSLGNAFKRPPVPIPFRESARKGARKSTMRRCVFYSPSSSLGLIETRVLAAAAGLLALQRQRRRDLGFRKNRARQVVIFPRQSDCLHHGRASVLRVV